MLEVKKVDGILFVHRHFVETRNAFSLSEAGELLQKLHEEKPSGLLLTAGGSVFCSGGQLKEYAARPEDGVTVNLEITGILQKIVELPIPKCVLVDGGCFGGGVELISAFDRVLATPRAQFALWQRRIGLSFGWGGEARLVQRMGCGALKDWYVTTKLINVYAAQRLGLVDEVVSLSRGVVAAEEWLRSSSQYSKMALSAFSDPQLSESETFSKLWLNEDHKKALAPYSS